MGKGVMSRSKMVPGPSRPRRRRVRSRGQATEGQEETAGLSQEQTVQLSQSLHCLQQELEMGEAVGVGGGSPTDQQVLALLLQFEKASTHRDVDSVISQLYALLIMRQSDGRAVPEAPSESDGESSPGGGQWQRGDLGASQASVQSVGEDELRFREQALVARSLVNYGYGLDCLEEEARRRPGGVVVERNRYKALSNQVATLTYRLLECFVAEECGVRVEPLNAEEARLVEKVLLRGRQRLGEDNNTLRKFMKLRFKCGNAAIEEEEALKLYARVQGELTARLEEIRRERDEDIVRINKDFRARRSFQNEKFELHRIWNDGLEREMLEIYKQVRSLDVWVRLRDYFKRRYPRHQHLFTLDSLKSRFSKIVRVAVRKTNCFCEKFGPERIPILVHLSDTRIKELLRSPQGAQARLQLCDIYLNDHCHIKQLYNTVSAVNDFCILKQTEKSTQIEEAEPLLRLTDDKARANTQAVRQALLQPHQHPDSSQVYIKASADNYHHIVQEDAGKRLHYYRYFNCPPSALLKQERPEPSRLPAVKEEAQVESPLAGPEQMLLRSEEGQREWGGMEGDASGAGFGLGMGEEGQLGESE